jgi:hypothetical protein
MRMTAAKTVRAVGMFFLNLLLAAVFTDQLTSPFVRFDTHSIEGSIFKLNCLNAAVAFGLGYFVYWRWRPVSAKWVFIAGFCWFAQQALLLWFEQRSMGVLYRDSAVYWRHFGINCGGDFEACRDWLGYTIPLLRTSFYSGGAWCCSLIERPRSSFVTKRLAAIRRISLK